VFIINCPLTATAITVDIITTAASLMNFGVFIRAPHDLQKGSALGGWVGLVRLGLD
jgi:hypothetical protein